MCKTPHVFTLGKGKTRPKNSKLMHNAQCQKKTKLIFFQTLQDIRGNGLVQLAKLFKPNSQNRGN